MTALAQSAPIEASEPTERGRTGRRPRVASGVILITIIAVLLAGVVAMNVAVLRLNVQLDESGRERTRLRAENAALASDLSSEQATARMQAAARGAGLVQALDWETTYITLP